MPILNYTTKVSVRTTVQHIQNMLAVAGARAVMTEYGPDGSVASVAFQMEHDGQRVSFRLPANVAGVEAHLEKLAPRFRGRAQAERVAWRIVKDWVEAQLAFIEADQATPMQLFLPHAQDPTTGLTLHEIVEQRGVAGLLTHG